MEAQLQTILNEVRDARKNDLNAPKRISDRSRVVAMIKLVQVVLLPGFYHYRDYTPESALEELREDLKGEIAAALCFSGRNMMKAEELTEAFLHRLPSIMKILDTDIQAIYEGDPAAKSRAEVILCYPGFYAIMIYRMAHELYVLDVPYIPRIMTEYAHGKTGIDINPGATIGEYFCIDHGTGIVIGETAVIGTRVKLYQGVTIGAKSFEKDENGNPVKGGKRHPNIGDRVVIYANATILGGTTTIGDDCTVGGNVWLVRSLPAGSTIIHDREDHVIAGRMVWDYVI
ncbi:MAG: serine acetyltransferase [Solobacterium sp.]|nr:serine acetyltransferase [Solobacterium sp.]